MTGIAVYGGVGADQREPVEVLINLLHRNMPAPNRVALLAVRAHLALVDVGVAVGALRPDIRKDHLRVALRAGHAFVQAAQRVLRGVVIEFRNGADRFPAAQRVTVLARDAQTPVWTPRVGRRLRLPTRRLPAGEHRKRDYQMQQKRRSQGLPNPF
jgi:hypothetical protein